MSSLFSHNCCILQYILQEGQGKGGAVGEVKLKVNRAAGFSPSYREGQVTRRAFQQLVRHRYSSYAEVSLDSHIA